MTDPLNRRRFIAYDVFKLVVALLLLLLFLLLLFKPVPSSGFSATATVLGVVDVATATTQPNPTQIVEVESTNTPDSPEIEIIVPTINVPDGPIHAGPLTLTGQANPDTTIALFDGEGSLGETQVDEDGAWSLTVDLTEGERMLIAHNLDNSGEEIAASEPVSITVLPALADPDSEDTDENGDDVAAAGPTAEPQSQPNNAICGLGEIKRDVYVVNYCENLTRISERLGVTLAAMLAANPDITDPNVIFPGQRLNIPGK